VKASQIVEGVLFASDAPLKAEEIARADESLDEDRVQEAIEELRTLYDESERSFQVMELGEGFQLLTRSELAPYLERFDTVPRPTRLSGPALETLAIIAYRQPIGRIEIEFIRGVQAAGVIRTLHDRDLIDVVGRAEGLGRPLLYGTTRRFLEHFGFATLDDLPRPEELPIILRDRAPLDDLMEEDKAKEEAVQEELEIEEGAEASSDADSPPETVVSDPEAEADDPVAGDAMAEPDDPEAAIPDPFTEEAEELEELDESPESPEF
jgi:segregation and condensation protein B